MRPRPANLGSLRASVVRGPREDGRWYWRVRRYQGDGEETVWTGWASEAGILDVLAQLQLAPEERAQEGAPEVRVLADLLSYWLGYQEDRADLSPATVRLCRAAAGHLARTIGSTPIPAISHLTADAHRQRRLSGVGAPRASGRTVLYELGYLRQALRWAQEIAGIYSGPIPRARVEGADRPTYSRRTPTADEVARLLTWLEPRRPWLYRACYLAWVTGGRPGEVAALRWTDLDAGAGLLTLGRHPGARKTGERTIPLAPEVVAEILRWRSEVEGPTLHGARPATVRGSYRQIREAFREVGLQPWSWQGFRRSATDRLYEAGVDPAVEARLIGHSVVTALKAYRVARDRQLQEGARVLAGFSFPAQVVPGRADKSS